MASPSLSQCSESTGWDKQVNEGVDDSHPTPLLPVCMPAPRAQAQGQLLRRTGEGERSEKKPATSQTFPIPGFWGLALS